MNPTKNHKHLLLLTIIEVHKKSQAMEKNWNIHKHNNVAKNHKHIRIETMLKFISSNVQMALGPQMFHQIYFQIVMSLQFI
jgi:hypothetical protein